MRQTWSILVVGILILILGLLYRSPSAEAQTSRKFPETGFTVSGSILDYWTRNGGLPVFGYPITEQRTETIEGWTGPVQWFERDRLEDHGPQGVMAGRLGARILELQGRPWQTSFPQQDQGPRGCEFFSQTGHALCSPFLEYWRNKGGLERFGYPISDALNESIGTWNGNVQYFERRRLEHHTEKSGTAYEILLGLLGKDVLNFAKDNQPTPTPVCTQTVTDDLKKAFSHKDVDSFRDLMGCPGVSYKEVTGAMQNFQNGVMIWVDLTQQKPANGKKIFAYVSGYHKTFEDTWEKGTDPDEPDVKPPDGFFRPRRGFGKAWISSPDFRDRIGWAIEQQEKAHKVTLQFFDKGTIVWLTDTDTVYVLGPDDWNAVIVPRY